MSTFKQFEDITAWQNARKLNSIIFNYLKRDEFKFDFKLINQMSGSVGSIMDNIAEGCGRGSTREFIQFLGFAKGSCNEIKSQLYRSYDRKLISKAEFDLSYDLADKVYRECQNLSTYLNTSDIRGEKFRNRT